jgi:hypothetical protein
MSPKLENFRQAFSPPFSSIRVLCHCETTYYDSQDEGCFEPGELDSLRANPKAVELDRGTGWVIFEGKEHCWDCACWHERAEKLIAWIDSHAEGIADYLSRERKRKFDEAERSPVVTE